MEDVETTISVMHDEALRARSISLVHRLLSGAGRASVVAYDLAPVVEAEAITHALSDVGELMVACIADEEIPLTTWGQLPVRVRMDVVKEAPEWSVRITACAVHLLGVLEWLDGDVRDSYLAGAGLPARMVELASARGGRLGIVRTERVLLHDATGVTPVPFEEIAERAVRTVASFPDADAEWAARELFGRLAPTDVSDLLEAAAAGWDAAFPLSVREQGGCPHLHGQVFCVDVDSNGLTVMDVDSGFTSVVLFTFDTPATSVEEQGHRRGQHLRGGAG
ncbi:hypothetical protein, partial [Propionicimonas sp.]|uniref:hypothetical protein n=1 Tax=Propionicimonas sp. TaxID=1955623 RepID=UPI0039E2DCE6